MPKRAWVVTFAGMAVNLCLGILYAWSVWKLALVNKELAGQPMDPAGLNAGWSYLSESEGNAAYMLCGLIFALAMIPGGKIQAKYGPKVGATLGGLSLAGGCILAGLLKTYTGLIVGFGILGGIGMGLGYAAATPAAVKWFGPHRRGLVVGLVVAGFGGAAIYISPLATWLLSSYGLTTSFVALGVAFAVVIVVAGQLLTFPPADYVPPGPPAGKLSAAAQASLTANDQSASQMLRTWQFYALVFLFFGSAQSGLLVIANAAPILKKAAIGKSAFLATNAWLLSAYGGFVNASGRIGTGQYSDRLGRINAYFMNAVIAAICVFATPAIMQAQNLLLLFVVVGIAFWQYGGGLALLPAFTADYFGTKNLGFNYGLVFLGWGLAFLISQVASEIEKVTGHLDHAFYLSGGILVAAAVLSRFLRRPKLGA